MARHNDIRRVAAYCRFSSEMQREESIEAQLRAIEKYATDNGYILVATYIDRARSAKSDDRPEFQRMMADVEKDLFDAVVVHKLDRFSRNRYVSAIYKHKLKLYDIRLLSVTEHLDGSPESIILEGLIEGMAEYYSANLAREVEKGRRENALKGMHVGGTPPLGYDVNPDTHLLVINQREAEAVRIIFDMYDRGEGYAAITGRLNALGYLTKRGNPFGRNSLYEILHNEKYTGVYTYNKSSEKNAAGKFNRHSYKSEEEIIRLPGGAPQIIPPELFASVQKKMLERKHHAEKYHAKQEYLLSGKIKCGLCGSSYAGNSRKARPDHPIYVSYRCTRKNRTVTCNNPEVRREKLEETIMTILSERIFDERLFPSLMDAYSEYISGEQSESQERSTILSARLNELNQGISNIVGIMVNTGSPALAEKLRELENSKAIVQNQLSQLEQLNSRCMIDPVKLKTAFRKAKAQLREGTLVNRREIVDIYVRQITIFREEIEITLLPLPNYQLTEIVPR